jgi:hypothetical protein
MLGWSYCFINAKISPSELATVAQWTKDEAAAKNLLL